MQKFLISVLGAWILSTFLFFFYAVKSPGETLFSDLSFTFLFFWFLSFSFSLILYAVRIFYTNFLHRHRIKTDATQDLRPLWRSSFKISSLISFFVSFIAFLKLEEQLNKFNLIILTAIILIAIIWLKSES